MYFQFNNQLAKAIVFFGAFFVILGFNVNLSAQKVRLRAKVTPNCTATPSGRPNEFYADISADGNVAVQGGFGCRGAYIYDISNPDAPVFASRYSTSNEDYFHEPIVVGNRAYLGGGINSGVHILDISNPYNPVLLGVVDSTHGNGFDKIHEMVVWGNYLIENLNGSPNRIVKFINISNPANPVFIRDLQVQELKWIHAMHVRGNRMITSGFGGFNDRGKTEIYDISNIETQAPTLLGFIQDNTSSNVGNDNWMHSSWTSEDGNYLYSCREQFEVEGVQEGGDLRVYDIHNPAQPVLVNRITTNGLGLNAWTPHNPIVLGNLLYVGWYHAGLQIFDITNPANPKRVGQYDSYQPAFAPTAESRRKLSNKEPWDIICGSENLQTALPDGALGAWTAYPLLGQDKVLIGDITIGLLIVDASQVNAPLRNQVSDFDGDRKTDFSVYTPNGGLWTIEKSSDNSSVQTNFGLSGDKPAAGDYDGDGKSDIAVFRPGEGVWYVLGSTRGFFARQFGIVDDIPVAGDYDSDGKTDFAVYRPSEGVWYIQQSTLGIRIVRWGLSTDKPLVGDYEGDGKADLAVFRPSDGSWYILQSSSSLSIIRQFGLSSDKPLAGDFDGDGKSDFAVYRPTEGNWYILKSFDNSLLINHFGLAADLPIPADYDGDGKSDIAVFRASDNIWYRLNSTNGAFSARVFGQSGDVPSPSSAQP